MQDSMRGPCPICERPNVTMYDGERRGSMFYRRFQCDRCGQFWIQDMLRTTGFAQGFADVRHLVSAYIRRQNRAGVIPPFSYYDHVEKADWPRFRHMGLPESVSEKMHALLLAYADSVGGEYARPVNPGPPNLVAEIAARSHGEVVALAQLLFDRGYTTSVQNGRITADGWARVDELRKAPSGGDSAFVAMWFDAATAGLRKAIVAAVSRCGYKPVIIDEVDYTGFVMDQVVAQIRTSSFAIADFTCEPEEDDASCPKARKGTRGGVYWEAGFAFGLGKPVIHTCQDTEAARRRAHFDIEQYNTIFWGDDDLGTGIRDMTGPIDTPTFAEKLAARILTIVGKGPWQQNGSSD